MFLKKKISIMIKSVKGLASYNVSLYWIQGLYSQHFIFFVTYEWAQ